MGAGKPTVPFEESLLRWPLPPGEEKYGVIDGKVLKRDVVAMIAISRRYKDQGHEEWGRLQGMSSDVETAAWVESRYRDIGLTNVRQEPLDLPPVWRYDSWSVKIDDGRGVPIALETAEPETQALTPAGGLNLEVVYGGLGSAADLAGRNLHGKAVLIRAEPWPGAYADSSRQNGATNRAVAMGAAAVLTSIDVPGNMRIRHNDGDPGPIPTFLLGYDDGQTLEKAIETAPEGHPPHVNIAVSGKMNPNLKTANVIAELPGMTDETIYIIGHRDAYFDGGTDNGSGMATLLGLADFYAKQPREQRKRTIVFVATPGHHTTDLGAPALAAKRDTLFKKLALVINCEHTARVEVEPFGYNGKEAGPHLRLANSSQGPMFWYSGGSPAFKKMVWDSFHEFGVPLYEHPDRVAQGETRTIYRMGAAAFQVVDAFIYYHTDQETADEVPYTGLEASTRAFAKIIDGANTLDLAQLARTPSDPE